MPNHESALSALSEYANPPHVASCSTHCLAECYAVLTAIPLARRITPAEAERLITESVAGRLSVYELTEADYLEATSLVARSGLVSGAVYDAIHVVAAIRAGSDRIITYNARHFRRMTPDHIAVATP